MSPGTQSHYWQRDKGKGRDLCGPVDRQSHAGDVDGRLSEGGEKYGGVEEASERSKGVHVVQR